MVSERRPFACQAAGSIPDPVTVSYSDPSGRPATLCIEGIRFHHAAHSQCQDPARRPRVLVLHHRGRLDADPGASAVLYLLFKGRQVRTPSVVVAVAVMFFLLLVLLLPLLLLLLRLLLLLLLFFAVSGAVVVAVVCRLFLSLTLLLFLLLCVACVFFFDPTPLALIIILMCVYYVRVQLLCLRCKKGTWSELGALLTWGHDWD